MPFHHKPSFLKLLYLCVILIFLGRGLQLLIWEAPFRAFFWDEAWLKPIVEGVFNGDWTAYTQSMVVNERIQALNKVCGIILILAAVSTFILYLDYQHKILQLFVWLGIVVIGIILLLEYKEKFYHFAQFLEGFTQFFTPILCLLFIKHKINLKVLDYGLRTIIALTFVGHGLYAINLYATPGHFVDMVIQILGVTEDTARFILLIVGWLDILLIMLIFLPWTQKISLYYALIWGLLTALARFVFFFKLNDYHLQTFDVIHSTLYRLPHGLVPLVILLLFNFRSKQISNENN